MQYKSAIKLELLQDQGLKLEDLLEASHRQLAAHDGAKQALRQHAHQTAQLAGLVDRDSAAGTLDFASPAAAAAYVKQLIDRIAQGLLGAAQHQETLQLTAQGEISAYRGLLAQYLKDVTAEKAKLQALQQAVVDAANPPSTPPVAPGAPASRPTGVRPDMGVAAQRRAEALAAAGAPTPPAPEASDAPAPLPAPRPLPQVMMPAPAPAPQPVIPAAPKAKAQAKRRKP